MRDAQDTEDRFLRLDVVRTVRPGRMREVIRVSSLRSRPAMVEIRVDFASDFASMPSIRVGRSTRAVPFELSDLNGLRLAMSSRPEDPFFAAGAPWYFTLFGRDSLWTSRLLLPVDVAQAGSTLRVLGRLAGTEVDIDSAEEPGKIPHELRRGTFTFGETSLPPVYYGTIDATPLWVCLLHDAWRAGLPEDEVGDLLPVLEGALLWMTRSGDADGDGFLEYIDRSGHGLANQVWKDSPDSVRFHDGRIATSNIGHLLGTGLLDAEEERLVAARVTAAELDSGLGLRTMSSSAGGYNPLSYHCGSVWPHDTAIVIAALERSGHGEAAAGLVAGLLEASAAFHGRLPELWSGEGSPVPYPSACRPQARSAAAAVTVAAWLAER